MNDDLTRQQEFFQRVIDEANEGDARSMISVGLCYTNGLGVDEDIELSKHWLNKALRTEEPEALSDLGELYLNGDLIDKDLDKAKIIFDNLVNIYPLFGYYMLGKYYLLDNNNISAVDCFRKASNMGHVISKIYFNRLSRKGYIGRFSQLAAYLQIPYLIINIWVCVYTKNSYVKLWRYKDVISSDKFHRIVIRQWKTRGIIEE